jgi:LPS-assembly protein
MVGLQYNSCCYAITVGYERKLNGWDSTRQQSEYESFNHAEM